MKIKTLLLLLSVAFIPSCNNTIKPIKIDFVTEPCLIPQKDNTFKLCDNMIVKVDSQFHVIPHGFKTDLASIPRIMWPVFSPDDYDSIAPAVMHDWHYCCDQDIDRIQADRIFYYSLIAQGSSKTKAYIYYMGVRAIGWLYFTHGLGMEQHKGEFQPNELQGKYDDDTCGVG
jgi:hypothetical protein